MMRALVPEDLSRSARQLERHRTLHRVIGAHAIAAVTKTAPEHVAAKAWPNDNATKAAVDITDTVNAVAYAPTVNSNALTGIAPTSAAARLFENDRTIRLDFRGVHIYAIPRGSLIPVPIFIGEGKPMPMSQVALDPTLVGPVRKILLGTAITNELEFFSANTAASVIGTILSEQASLSLDAVVFDDLPADDLRPAGLLHNVTPIAATAGGGAGAMATDLANVAQAISDAGISPAGLVFIAGAAAAVKLKLTAGPMFDYQILESTGVPGTTLIAVQPAAIATGFSGQPTVETSKHAVAHFDDVTLLPIASPGSPATVSAVVRSAWQQNLLFLKCRLQGAWASVHPGAVQVVNSVSW